MKPNLSVCIEQFSNCFYFNVKKYLKKIYILKVNLPYIGKVNEAYCCLSVSMKEHIKKKTHISVFYDFFLRRVLF